MSIRSSLLRFTSLKQPVGCTCSSRRWASTSTSTSPPPSIYVSESNDPYFNLAYEDWLFRKTDPNQVILYIYRNKPSVIIGRNQNPWKEINLNRLKELEIPFVRRKSGGGTVYHDLGNTNYCVFVPRLQFERKTHAALVARALNRLEIPAFVNNRNDICVDSYKMSSAFKLVNARAYHHGTMLIDAKLGNLRGVLGTEKENLITKGVASVSSPVRNLVEWSNKINHNSFIEVVAAEFGEMYPNDTRIKFVNDSEAEKNDYVKDVTKELKSWEWTLGQTPEFTHTITKAFPSGNLTLEIHSRHALITSVNLLNAPNDRDWWRLAEALVTELRGDRYGTLENVEKFVNQAQGIKKTRLRDLVDWLKSVM